MLFKNAALFLGLVGTAAAQSAAPTSAPIAGYIPRSDALEFLEKDLIQKELEDLIGDETCASFALASDFYETGNGSYFKTIPTFSSPKSLPFEEMTKYYGKTDFVQIWAKKAIQKRRTNFIRGNADFKDAFDPPTVPAADAADGKFCVGYEEVLKKGLSYGSTIVEMYQLMQKAIESAKGGCIAQDNSPFGGPARCLDAVKAWDGAAAIYVGSLEGTDGKNDYVTTEPSPSTKKTGSYGKAPYALADKRCRNFKNCGPDNGADYPATSNPKTITAAANNRILALFAAGSHATWVGDYRLMEGYLRLISNKSAIALIQGTFRYYYRLSNLEFGGTNTYSIFDKELGEGGAFIFPILPKLWACSKKGEKRAYEVSRIENRGAGRDFLALQLAIECNYQCLGITCAEVGTLYDGDDEPKNNYNNCDDESNGSTNVCAKQSGTRKSACKLYVGSPGIKDRNKLKFEF